MGIVKKAFKRQANFIRTAGPVVSLFVPGLGTVSESVAKAYDKLAAGKKAKFHKAKGKTAKMKILRS